MTRTTTALALGLVALVLPAVASAAPECVGTRYIGYLPPDGSCSGTVGGWARAPLFTYGPGELARYCTYTWAGSGPPTPGSLPSLGAGQGPTLDCAGVTPHAAGALELAERAQLEASFRTQVEALAALPSTSLAWTQTKVVIVDSAMTSGFPEPGTGLIEHGRAMGVIVRTLACGDGSGPACRAVVSNSLALPLVRQGNTLVRQTNPGGRLGSFGDVASALYDGYRAAASTAPLAAPIILNASVGWDPALGGAFSGINHTTLSPPIRAVYSALTYIACRGGLVVAASGNASGGTDESSGAAFPAAWESKPAPGVMRCGDVGGQAPGLPTSATTYRRLLYAVGGIDPRDRPLATRRPESTPSLVAPASHATLTYGTFTPTRVLTGSSVGAAVATGVLATAWSYLPGASPHDVVDRVRTSAIGVGQVPSLQVESCGAAGCPSEVRRISLCRAVADACGGPSCTPAVVGCPALMVPRDARPTGLVYRAPGMIELPAPQYLPGAPPPVGSACNVDLHYTDQAVLAPTCPSDQYPNNYAFPYSGPQPGGTLCPTCELRKRGDVVVEINPDWMGLVVDPVVITTMNDGTRVVYALDVAADDLMPGSMFKITGTGIPTVDVRSAEFEVKVVNDNTAYSTSSPMIIEP
jgi:hypothetical protein